MPSIGAGARAPEPNAIRHAGKAVPGTINLPRTYDGPVPTFPLPEASPRELELWEIHWRKPQANMWAQQGIEGMLARYIRVTANLENCLVVNVAIAHLHSEARQLEDRLGLNPLSLMRMKWQVAEDEVEGQRKRANAKTSVRRLRAVDPKAGA